MLTSDDLRGATAAPPQPDQRERPRRSAFRLTHLPALDGLRGLAVLAVVLFHTGHLTGGYLGVDLFLVLSGFLITTLLLGERQRDGAISLSSFWRRRARRLVPALVALLGGVALYAAFFADPTELGRIRSDAVATVLYVANWHSIASGNGYWGQFGAPSPLQHTWSLAIEEQFYLVWPLLLVGLLWWRRGSRRAVLLLCGVGAVAAALRMALLFDPLSTDRAYLGTDTRAMAVLLGAGLAAWMQWKGPVDRSRRFALEVAAVVAVAWLAVMWFVLDGQHPFLYRGGMLLCGVAVVVVIAAATHPVPGRVARVLSWAPLCWIGLISYGLYLWHWPVIVAVTPDRTGLDGWTLTAAQVGLSIAIAVISYHLLELPIRRDGLQAWRRPALMPVAALAVALALIVFTRDAVDPVVDTASDGDQQELAREAGDPVGVQNPAARADKSAPLPRPEGRLPRLLVVGDSVGGSLGEPLQKDPSRFQVQTVSRAIPACTLDRDSGRTRSVSGAPRQEAPWCREWPSRWADDVARFRPDAVLMAFGGINGEPREIDGTYHDMCEPFTLSWYRRELDDAFSLLSGSGAVVFVTPFAYSTATARPDAARTSACLNPVIRQAADAHPFARVIPLDTWVCPTSPTVCRQTIDGEKLRFDGLHYRGHAADEANRWILSQVFAAPGTGTTAPTAPPAGDPSTTFAPLPPPVMATVAPTTTPRPSSPSTANSPASPAAGRRP